MCGIVGYVGPRQSQAILSAGLSRLEYRGLRLRRHRRHRRRRRPRHAQARRQARRAARRPHGHAARRRHHRHRPHPLGHPRRPDRRQRAPAPRRRRQARRHPQRHHRELRRAQGRAARRGLHFPQRDRHRGRRRAARPRVPPARRRPRRRLPRRRQRLEGAFTLLAMHEDQPGLVVGARRNSPLVIGLGEGENFLGSDVAAFVEHTRNALAIGQDQIVAITPEGVARHRLRGQPVEVEPFEVLWDAAAADKGGWSSFMAKEVSEEPEAVAKTILGRIRDGQVVDPGARRSRRAVHRHRPHHRHRVRHRRVRRLGRQVRDRAVDPRAGRRRARA